MQTDSQFIDEVATLLSIWGVAPMPGRLFGHLLLRQQPATLDEICSDLNVSKTTASDAAKRMERYGFVRRYGTPGTKRASYGPSEDFTAFYRLQSSYLERMGRVLARQARADTAPRPAERLDRMAEYYTRLAQAMDDISKDYEA